MWYLSFSVWLISLSIIFSRSIHVVANVRVSFFFMVELYSIVYMYHFFIHSSISGHVGFFHILAIVTNAAVNIGVHLYFLISVFVFFGKIFRSGIAKLYGSSIFHILRNQKLYFSVLVFYNYNFVIVFFKNKFIYLFIFGCAGSLLLRVDFL